MKTFNDSDGLLCVRRVRYRFRFSDSTPTTPHADYQNVAFAYFCMDSAPQDDDGRLEGLFVAPTHTGYELRCLYLCEDDDDEIVVMAVQPDTWYDVEMSYAWHKDDASWARVTCKGEEGSSSVHLPYHRLPLRTIKLYNYSTGVACYSAIEVWYSPHTSRDGPFSRHPDLREE